MKNTMDLNNGTYSKNDICPVCGIYEPEGQVCGECLKDYNLHKKRESYNEAYEVVQYLNRRGIEINYK